MINKLEAIGVEKILINTHYLSEKVDSFLNKKYKNNKKIKKIYEDELLGTAGTLIANRDFFNDSICIMIHADNFTNMEMKDLIKANNKKPKNCLMTMLTFTSNDPKSCGIVEVDNEGILINFHEKVENPPGEMANGAVYVFDNEFLDWILKTIQKLRILAEKYYLFEW